MSFYLGVWNSPTAISDDEAASQYSVLHDQESVPPKFDAQVYGFYCRLISLFPEVEMVPEDEFDACPWTCGIDLAADHVILPIQIEHAQKIIGQIVSLAAQYELVCFDPQAGKVYLPPRFEAKRAAAAAGPACASGSQPSTIRLNDEPETGSGEGLQPNPKPATDAHLKPNPRRRLFPTLQRILALAAAEPEGSGKSPALETAAGKVKIERTKPLLVLAGQFLEAGVRVGVETYYFCRRIVRFIANAGRKTLQPRSILLFRRSRSRSV